MVHHRSVSEKMYDKINLYGKPMIVYCIERDIIYGLFIMYCVNNYWHQVAFK